MDGGCWFENVSISLCLLVSTLSVSYALMTTACRWVDLMGNVHGRVDGINASAPALLMGSHMVIYFSPLPNSPCIVLFGSLLISFCFGLA